MRSIVRAGGIAMLCLTADSVTAQQSQSIDAYVVAQEIPRFALVVGVQHYNFLDPVPNALNDSAAAARAFRRAGFGTVIEIPDATSSMLETGIAHLLQLADRTKKPAVVAIFFAGHGFQSGIDNYIVPKDARLASLLEDSTPVGSVVAELSPREVGLTFLFLDACRTLTLSGSSPGGTPAVVRPGFAKVESIDRTVMSFASGFNQAALSKAEETAVNSPYTEGLLEHLNVEGASVAQILDGIYKWVKARTQDRQEPVPLAAAATSTIRFMPLVAPSELDAEEQHWRRVLAANRAYCVRDFLLSYPHSRFAVAALKWLSENPSSTLPRPGEPPCPQR